MIGQREGTGRGAGVPRTDIERACNHYGITPEEYLANPDLYPLPPRGTRLSQTVGSEWISAIVVIGAVGIGLLLIGKIVKGQ